MGVESRGLKKQPLDRSLLRMILGQCISMIGDSFTGLALTWFIVETGSAMQVGINMALMWVPSIVLAPFIGSMIDRMSRRTLLWGSDILRLILDLVLILVITKGWFSIYVIYVYTVLKAIVRLVYRPAQRAVIQQLTTSEQRVAANALQDLTMRIAMVGGPLVAGLAVKHFSKQLVIGIDALTFLISALMIFSISLDESHIKKQKKEHSYWQQMRDGLAYVSVNRWIVLLSFAYAFCNGGNALVGVTRPFLVKDELGLGADAFGLLSSLASVGGMLVSAALVKIKLKGHKLNYVIVSLVIWGAGVMLLSLATSFWAVAIIQTIAFAAGPIMVVCNNTFYQNEIPSEYMGRVGAVRSFVSTLAMPVGALFGSAVVNIFGISGSFVMSGAIVMLGAVFAFVAKQSHGKIRKEVVSEVGE